MKFKLVEAFTYGIKLNAKKKKELNKICSKYCGYHLPEEVRPLWDELTDAGVDPILIMGMPHDVSESGCKHWAIGFTMGDEPVTNSQFIYQVYEGNPDTLKNDYNIYFS